MHTGENRGRNRNSPWGEYGPHRNPLRKSPTGLTEAPSGSRPHVTPWGDSVGMRGMASHPCRKAHPPDTLNKRLTHTHTHSEWEELDGSRPRYGGGELYRAGRRGPRGELVRSSTPHEALDGKRLWTATDLPRSLMGARRTRRDALRAATTNKPPACNSLPACQ